MLFTVLIISLQITLSYNKESGCGCNINRDEKQMQPSMFSGSNNNIDQSSHCSSEERCSALEEDKEADRMVLIPAGEYQFGTDDIAIESDKEGPKQMKTLDSFYLDKYEVSNNDFDNFVLSTNYKTEAEHFGDSFVFTAFLNTTFKEQLNDFRVMQATWWYKVFGADWKHPYGPDSNIKGSLYSFIW